MKLYEELNRIRELSGIIMNKEVVQEAAIPSEVKRFLMKLDPSDTATMLAPKIQNAPGTVGKVGLSQFDKIFKDFFDVIGDPDKEAEMQKKVKPFVSKFKGKVWMIDAANFSIDGREVFLAFAGKVSKAQAEKWFLEFFPGIMEALGVKEVPQINIKKLESADEDASNPDSPFDPGTDVTGWIITWFPAE